MEVGTKQIYLSNFTSMVMEQGTKYVASHHPIIFSRTNGHVDSKISWNRVYNSSVLSMEQGIRRKPQPHIPVTLGVMYPPGPRSSGPASKE